jgi:hypothetical protein
MMNIPNPMELHFADNFIRPALGRPQADAEPSALSAMQTGGFVESVNGATEAAFLAVPLPAVTTSQLPSQSSRQPCFESSVSHRYTLSLMQLSTQFSPLLHHHQVASRQVHLPCSVSLSPRSDRRRKTGRTTNKQIGIRRNSFPV